MIDVKFFPAKTIADVDAMTQDEVIWKLTTHSAELHVKVFLYEECAK